MNTNKRFVLVTSENYNPIADFIRSIGFIDKTILLKDFDEGLFNISDHYYIFTQIWINIDTFSKSVLHSYKFIYMNFEMLTEINRMNHIVELVKQGCKIMDYSLSNIRFLIDFLRDRNVPFDVTKLLYIPYQWSADENELLKNTTGEYTHDIGVINAFPPRDADCKLTFKRTELWHKLQQEKELSCINIEGWGEERDRALQKCKLILNVHHFDIFTVFEHIRCDRLLFAGKVVISEPSLYMEQLDIAKEVVWSNYDDIIELSKTVLGSFDLLSKTKSNASTVAFYERVAANRRTVLDKTLDKLTHDVFTSRSKIINSFIKETDKYLEIGIDNGETFKYVKCLHKTGVDPEPRYKSPSVIEKTSDDFFSSNTELFDVVFIDGMHQVEFIIRDFVNAMKCLNDGGVILFDDVFPLNETEQRHIPQEHYIENGILKANCYWPGS